MQIDLGGQKLPINRPDDLNDRVIAATGCSVDELEASLTSGPTPILLAELLHPCVSGPDAPAKPKLAQMLAAALAEDAAGTVAAVRKAIALPEKPKRSAD